MTTGNNAPREEKMIQDALERVRSFLQARGAVTVNLSHLEELLRRLAALSSGDAATDAAAIKEDIARIKAEPEKRKPILARIASSVRERQHEGETLIQNVLSAFFGSVMSETIVVPESFWASPIGKVVREVRKGPPDALLTAGDAALLLGVSRQYVHDEMTAGRIPYQTVGKYGIIRLADLLTYEEGRRAS